jgi:DNA repair protein RadA/Sms
MQKTITLFECQTCGASYPKWQGCCDGCEQWNSIIEIKQEKSAKKQSVITKETQSKTLASIEKEENYFYRTTIQEFDQVLGEGICKGSVVLLSGEPGIGKSTISLQVCQKCSASGLKVLYVSSEESESQLKIRAQRFGNISQSLWVYSETNMQHIIQECDRIKPDLILLDSIQVVQHPELTALEGTVSQVRQCASALIAWVKNHNASAIMIGHITKDGQIAGPKVLEHLVDVILYLEGSKNFSNRVLRCTKNRYGSTENIGLFEMKFNGLVALTDPSKAFIKTFQNNVPGSVIVPYAEGNRVLLIEVQALVVETSYGMAKRNFVGVNQHRANLLIAVLDKLFKFKLASHDIFLSVVGGLKVNDPSVDLAIVIAVISSLKQKPVRSKCGVCGEIGLTGEVRPVSYSEKRVKELIKSGFERCIIPEKNKEFGLDDCENQINYVRFIADSITAAFTYD